MNVTLKENNRLDHYVTAKIKVSRNFSHNLIISNKVRVNNQILDKPSYRLKKEDKVQIDYKPSDILVPKINLKILYEDKDCIVIDKPNGLLSHAKGEYNTEPSVASWLSDKVTGLNGNRAGIVHRLDRATSGVMICAKQPDALKWLQNQFSTRKVKKTYFAIIKGTLKLNEAIIDIPIERNPSKPQTFRVHANGKNAQTSYKVERTNDIFSLIKLTPKTGRTHQLRVHLKHLNHPIVGDIIYNGEKADRLYLHAYSLEITLLNRKRMTFISDLPITFSNII